MIVIVSSQGNTIESPVNERFGRTPYLIKVDTITMEWQAFENPSVFNAHGAGVATSQFVIEQKADLVMSGDFGPNAVNALNSASIVMETFTDKNITVLEAVNSLNKTTQVS